MNSLNVRKSWKVCYMRYSSSSSYTQVRLANIIYSVRATKRREERKTLQGNDFEVFLWLHVDWWIFFWVIFIGCFEKFWEIFKVWWGEIRKALKKSGKSIKRDLKTFASNWKTRLGVTNLSFEIEKLGNSLKI